MNQLTDPTLLAEFNQSAPPDSGFDPQAEMEERERMRGAFDDTSSFDQFGVGIAKPVVQTYLGAKELFTDLTPDEQFQLRALEEVHGGAALAGEMTAEAASLALPLGWLAKGVKSTINVARPLARTLAGLGAESVAVGALEGVKAPEAGETRLGNATQGAVLTGALGALPAGFIAGKEAIPKAARTLLDDGVPLTAGMASGTGIATGLEKFLSTIPIVGRNVKKLQDKAINQWNKKLLKGTSPSPDDIKSIGHEGFQQAQDAFKEAYRRIWDSVKPDTLNLSALDDGIKSAKAYMSRLPQDAINKARGVVDDVETTVLRFLDDADPRQIERLDDTLRAAVNDAPDEMTREYFKKLRKSLKDSLGDTTAGKELADVDKLYRNFSVVERGGSYVRPQEAGAVLSPRDLESAVRAKNSPRATTSGKGAMQGEAADATSTIGKVLQPRSEVSSAGDLGKWGTILGVAANPVAALALPASKLLINDPVRKALTSAPTVGGDAVARALRQLGVTYQDGSE